MELIDKKYLLKVLRKQQKECEKDGEEMGGEAVLLAEGISDAIDVVCDVPPVMNAIILKNGEWIEKPFLLGTSNFCSLCGENYGMPHGKFNYCPNCGAKMDL